MNAKFTDWFKSTYSDPNTNCFEVAFADDGSGSVGVRDSKLGDASPVLEFTRDEWLAAVAGFKDGQFDQS